MGTAQVFAHGCLHHAEKTSPKCLWNQTVAPGDSVYVKGDFGSDEWMKYLNGDIHTI